MELKHTKCVCSTLENLFAQLSNVYTEKSDFYFYASNWIETLYDSIKVLISLNLTFI